MDRWTGPGCGRGRDGGGAARTSPPAGRAGYRLGRGWRLGAGRGRGHAFRSAEVLTCGTRWVQVGAGLAPRAGPRGVGRRHPDLRAARPSAWGPLLPLAPDAHRVSVRAAEGQARGLTPGPHGWPGGVPEPQIRQARPTDGSQRLQPVQPPCLSGLHSLMGALGGRMQTGTSFHACSLATDQAWPQGPYSPLARERPPRGLWEVQKPPVCNPPAP